MFCRFVQFKCEQHVGEWLGFVVVTLMEAAIVQYHPPEVCILDFVVVARLCRRCGGFQTSDKHHRWPRTVAVAAVGASTIINIVIPYSHILDTSKIPRDGIGNDSGLETSLSISTFSVLLLLLLVLLLQLLLLLLWWWWWWWLGLACGWVWD